MFTHLDADLWPRFLRVFCSFLRQGGILVFSTHGYDAYRRMATDGVNYGIPYYRKTSILYNYERDGFGYGRYTGSDSYYGLSLSSSDWVLRQIAKVAGLRVVHFSEKSWDDSHDCFSCVRDPDWQQVPARISKYLFVKHKMREMINPKGSGEKLTA